MLASVASAESGPGCLQPIGTWGGYGFTEAVIASSHLAVFGGNALLVADVIDPGHPQLVGEVRLPALSSAARALCRGGSFDGEPNRLADLTWLEDGRTVVAAARCEGLAIFDLTDPERPKLVQSVPLPGETRLVAASNDDVVAVSYSTGEGLFTVRVHDLSRPLSPELLASVGGGGRPEGLAVEGDLAALVLAGSSEPGRLSRVELFDLSVSGDLKRLSPLLGSFSAVAAANHRLYLGRAGGELEIVDVSEPSSPRRLGLVTGLGERVRSVAVDGDLAVVVVGDHRLVLVDVGDPKTPRVVGTLTQPGAVALRSRVAMVDGYAFLAAGWDGMRVVDVSEPELPADVGFALEPTAVGEVQDLDWGFVVGIVPGRGLTVFDLSGADAPRARGIVGIEDSDRLPLAAGGVSGTRAYFVGNDDLWIFDLDDPDHPRVLEHLSGWDGQVALGIETLGGRAPLLFLIGDHGLSVLDVADPSRPRQLATPFDTHAYWHLSLWSEVRIGDALLLGQTTERDESPWGPLEVPPSGLRVLDVTDPLQPLETSWSETGHEMFEVVTDGRVAAAGADSSRVTLFDVKDPLHPRPAASLELDGLALGLALEQGLLAVCEWTDDDRGKGRDLLVVDVIDPEKPLVLDRVPVTHCVGLTLASGRLAVSGMNAGLEVWDASECNLRAPISGPPRQPSGRETGWRSATSTGGLPGLH